MRVRYYVLNHKHRWVRVNRVGYDTFMFVGDNVIYKFNDFQNKQIVF